MSSTSPDSSTVGYQDLGGDVYEIADAAHAPVGVVSLVGDRDWVAVCYRGRVVGCCPNKAAAATRLVTHSATHSRALSLPRPHPSG